MPFRRLRKRPPAKMPVSARAAFLVSTVVLVLGCVVALLVLAWTSNADTCTVDGCGAASPPPADVSVCDWSGGSEPNPNPVSGKPAGCTYCVGGRCHDKVPLGLDCGDDNDCQSNYCSGSTWGIEPLVCTGTVNTRCHNEGCDTAAAPPEDFSQCQWQDPGGGAFRPVGCAYCADGRCVNKLPLGATCADHNDCQSDACSNAFKCIDKPADGCEASGCGAAWNPPSDATVCHWLTQVRLRGVRSPRCEARTRGDCRRTCALTARRIDTDASRLPCTHPRAASPSSQPDGNHKPAGCAFCYGGQCVNKKPLGSLGCGDHNDCQTNYCLDGVCIREDPSRVCATEGCGSPAPPPSEPEVCKWGAGTPPAYKPIGCTYCKDGHCVDKLPPGGKFCDDDNDCQSNSCVERSACSGDPTKSCAVDEDCGD